MAHLKLDMLLTQTGAFPTTPPAGHPFDTKGNQTHARNSPSSEGVARSDGVVDRLRIYLTNSLEEHHPDTGTLFASWLSSEANEANQIKRDAPVMVVMGNPPYSVSSSNKSEWIQKLLVDYKKDLNERNIQPLSDDYIKFIRFGQHFIDKNGEGILAYISNNSFIDGIIHRQMRKNLLESFDEIYILDLHGNAKKKETAPDGSKDENVFDIMQGVSINLLIKKGKNTPSVTPAKAGVHVKNTAKMDSRFRGNDETEVKPLAKVFHHSLYGKREAKYNALHESNLASLPWQVINTKAPEYLFIQKDAVVEQVYQEGFSINALFTLSSSGIKTHRDHFVIDIDAKTLSNRIQRFYDLSVSDEVIKHEMCLKDNADFEVSKARRKNNFDEKLLQTITYRPFDNQAIYYETSLIDRDRQNVMRHMLAGENYGFITARSNKSQICDHFFITQNLMEIKAGESTVLSGIFPLYTYPDATTPSDLWSATPSEKGNYRTPNLNPAIVQQIANGLGLSFTPEKTSTVIPAQAGIQSNSTTQNVEKVQSSSHGLDSRLRGNDEHGCGNDGSENKSSEPKNDETCFAPIDLLDYLYAVLHSPSYRETYKEFLKIDFPRVPYPTDAAQFWQLVALGGELRKTHLLEAPSPPAPLPKGEGSVVGYPIAGNNVMDKLRFEIPSPQPSPASGRGGLVGRVYINATQYFETVPEIAWNFYIGGYQPAQKWLKDRKGRALGFEDIAHYQKIIAALSNTQRLMQEVDTVFKVN